MHISFRSKLKKNIFLNMTYKIEIKKINTCIYYCRDTIIHDPRMTLDSYVKGPNNIICRVWAWKAWPWSLDSGLVVVFMEAHMRVDLAWLTKPFFSVTYGVFVLGPRPRSLVFFSLSLFWDFYLRDPLPPWFFFPFILIVIFLSMSTCKFHFLKWRLVLSAYT